MTEEEFIASIINTKKTTNIVERIKEQAIPLVMWGAGSMAYSVKKYLNRNGIKLVAVLVDNASGNETFDNVPIVSMSVLKQKYEKVNIIMGHSQYDLGMKLKENNPNVKNIFYLSSVCYSQYDPISYDFVVKHAGDYTQSYNLLADQLSKRCMISYLNARVNENPEYIFDCCTEKNSYFKNVAFTIDSNETYLDIGAYTGDTIEEFIKENDGKYSRIVAVEPEKESFKSLNKYVTKNKLHDVDLYQVGCWNKEDRLYLTADEESSSVTKNISKDYIDVVRIDDLVSDIPFTLLKINYLQGVLETLQGASRTITRYKPKIIITVGFDEYGLINIPQFIKQLNLGYKVFLRYNAAMPARLTLYACV